MSTKTMVLPDIVLAGDSARARKSDPLSSHRAADRSESKRSRTERAVLMLLDVHGDLTGEELNELYELQQLRSPKVWPRVHWDSPRKRAGELVRKGMVRVVNEDDPRGTPAVYRLIEVTR